MPNVPTLTYDAKTKVNGEVMIYVCKYPGQILDFLRYTPGGVSKASDIGAVGCCGGECPCPPNSFEATVNLKENAANIGIIPSRSPVWSAAEGLINPGGDGDLVAHVCLPVFDDFELVCFDQGSSPTVGNNLKSIPRKFIPVDHRVRQRPELSVNFTELFVSNWKGLNSVKGIPCTVLMLITPDGVSIQEATFFSNVVLNSPPPPHGAETNDSVSITLEGDFNFMATFAAPPI